MRSTMAIRFIVLLLSVYASGAMAQTINIAQPEQVKVPVALANTGEGAPTFFTTPDGKYAVAYTRREAKAWRLPDGELVYRYQAGMDDPRPGKNYYDKFVNRVTITADSKIIYVSGRSWAEEVIVAADLETGELLMDGMLLDSLKSGAYQMKRSVGSFDEIEWNYRAVLTDPWSSPLKIKRDYKMIDKPGREGVTLKSIVPAKQYPGEVIICYKQSYCREGKWLGEAADKTNTTIREIEKLRTKDNTCLFMDAHAARVNLTTQTVTYLGAVPKGVQGVDYGYIHEIHPSPYGDVVGIVFNGAYDTIRFYSMDGVELWRTPKESAYSFTKYDDEGNVVLREKASDGSQYISSRKPLTGVLISRYQLPAENSNRYFLEQWGMLANISQGSDNNYTLTLHDAFNGKMLLALTDDIAAAQFANGYKAVVAKAEKERQERIRLQEQQRVYWEEERRRQRDRASAEESKYYVNNKTAATQHTSNYKQCPACGGTGGEYVQDTYTQSTVTTLWGGPRVGAAGYQKTTKTYNTPYKKFVQCNKCWGKGEVKK